MSLQELSKNVEKLKFKTARLRLLYEREDIEEAEDYAENHAKESYEAVREELEDINYSVPESTVQNDKVVLEGETVEIGDLLDQDTDVAEAARDHEEQITQSLKNGPSNLEDEARTVLKGYRNLHFRLKEDGLEMPYIEFESDAHRESTPGRSSNI